MQTQEVHDLAVKVAETVSGVKGLKVKVESVQPVPIGSEVVMSSEMEDGGNHLFAAEVVHQDASPENVEAYLKTLASSLVETVRNYPPPLTVKVEDVKPYQVGQRYQVDLVDATTGTLRLCLL